MHMAAARLETGYADPSAIIATRPVGAGGAGGRGQGGGLTLEMDYTDSDSGSAELDSEV